MVNTKDDRRGLTGAHHVTERAPQDKKCQARIHRKYFIYTNVWQEFAGNSLYTQRQRARCLSSRSQNALTQSKMFPSSRNKLAAYPLCVVANIPQHVLSSLLEHGRTIRAHTHSDLTSCMQHKDGPPLFRLCLQADAHLLTLPMKLASQSRLQVKGTIHPLQLLGVRKSYPTY